MNNLSSQPGECRRSVDKQIKPQHTLFLSLVLCFGCNAQRRNTVPHQYADFDSAVEVIATSADIHDANAAAAQLYSGGSPAIDALREHLDDQRVIPSGFCTRALNTYEGLTMAEQALWTIQEMIEPGLPKSVEYSHFLERGKVEQWLDERKGMSITDLRTEAARSVETAIGDTGLDANSMLQHGGALPDGTDDKTG